MKTNHRRKNPTLYPPDQPLRNGYRPTKAWGYLDKSLHDWGQTAPLSGVLVGHASIGNDFTNGHRGMAKSVRGAKKYVRSRVRFHDNAATKRLAREHVD